MREREPNQPRGPSSGGQEQRRHSKDGAKQPKPCVLNEQCALSMFSYLRDAFDGSTPYTQQRGCLQNALGRWAFQRGNGQQQELQGRSLCLLRIQHSAQRLKRGKRGSSLQTLSRESRSCKRHRLTSGSTPWPCRRCCLVSAA